MEIESTCRTTVRPQAYSWLGPASLVMNYQLIICISHSTLLYDSRLSWILDPQHLRVALVKYMWQSSVHFSLRGFLHEVSFLVMWGRHCFISENKMTLFRLCVYLALLSAIQVIHHQINYSVNQRLTRTHMRSCLHPHTHTHADRNT